MRKLKAVAIGEMVKVWLPGETPWAEVVALYGDGSWDGRIANRLFAEASEAERASFTRQNFGTVKALPRLHDYKQDQVVRFSWQNNPPDSEYWSWVPAGAGKVKKP